MVLAAQMSLPTGGIDPHTFSRVQTRVRAKPQDHFDAAARLVYIYLHFAAGANLRV